MQEVDVLPLRPTQPVVLGETTEQLVAGAREGAHVKQVLGYPVRSLRHA